MKRTPITAFQSRCHSIVKYVHATGEPVIITKRGKPLVKIVPIKSSPTEIFGFMADEFQIIGDIESPIFRSSPGRE
jgi:prevent-host-death family protein